MLFFWILVIITINLTCCNAAKPCIKKYFDQNSFVCVCNATYCDTIETFNEEDLQDGYVHYESNAESKRLFLTKENFSTQKEGNFINQILNFANSFNIFSPSGSFTVNDTKKYQEIFGFGGAITDTVGLLLKTSPKSAQDEILRQYFGDTGLNYTFIRIPIGCSDFSSRLYTYDDNGEGKSLANFNLTEEDYNFKIPYIKQIQDISSAPIKIIAAPWTAPQRMLESRYPLLCTEKCKKLKTDYYSTYAEYFVKFLDAYKKEGIPIWGLSPQNEPLVGMMGLLYPVNLGWTPWEQGKWISEDLGPRLNSSGYGDIKIIILDDERIELPIWPHIIMQYAKEYVSGIGIHGYTDWYFTAHLVGLTHVLFPDLFIISTETSLQQLPRLENPVRLGRWESLEFYVYDILEDFNNHVNGWIDWNIVLNDEGGPSFIHNKIDSPIIVSDNGKEYYKQPMWYGIAHVSRIVPPGSRRIDLKGPTLASDIMSAAFETPQNRLVIVILNRRKNSYEANINAGKGKLITLKMSPQSVHTIIYNKT